MIQERLIKYAAKRMPKRFKGLARRVYYRGRHWAHPGMKDVGTVQDLYYWVADGNLDTLLLLQNYFSALYPQFDTATNGTVSIRDSEGAVLGETGFSLNHRGAVKLRISSLLKEIQADAGITFGTLEVHISIPAGVLKHIQDAKPLYFWDRFYITYTTAQGQACFVHGIDKTHIYQEGKSSPTDWYGSPQDRQWAPEMPVNINEYQRFTVIMVNRTTQPAKMTLSLSDKKDETLSWSQEIAPKGAGRFELTQDDMGSLEPEELRMRMRGMATTWGRPMVFKEFANGAISAMHC